MIGKVLIFTTLVALCCGSAIPMWEFLSRGEKMSHLYSMFAKQVHVHCKTNVDSAILSQCKRNLMMHGLGKLHDMSESHLDVMDPYQRGANDIIWDSMMGTVQNTQVDDEKQHFLQEEQKHQQNPLFKNDDYSNKESTYESDGGMDSYDPQSNHLGASTNVNYNYASKPTQLDDNEHLEQNTNYLLGPMVTMVRPDGSPVAMNNPLPQDDDEMTIGREKMPTMQELMDQVQTYDEKPKIIMILPSSQATQSTQSIQFNTATAAQNIKSLYSNYRIQDRNDNFQ